MPIWRKRRRAGFWRDDTFHDILARRAAEHPDREVLYDRRARITYKELADRVDAVAAVLQAHGIGRHDIVTIQLPKLDRVRLCLFAVERLGAIAIQVSTDFREHELSFILKFSQSAAFISTLDFRGFDHMAMIEILRPDLPSLRVVACTDPVDRDGIVSLYDAVQDNVSAAGLAPVAMGPNEVYRMAFTSGTTGNPKAVIHCHKHDIVGMPDPERRSRYSCRRCLPPLSAARPQLGISGVAADRHRRSPGGTVGQIFRR